MEQVEFVVILGGLITCSNRPVIGLLGPHPLRSTMSPPSTSKALRNEELWSISS